MKLYERRLVFTDKEAQAYLRRRSTMLIISAFSLGYFQQKVPIIKILLRLRMSATILETSADGHLRVST